MNNNLRQNLFDLTQLVPILFIGVLVVGAALSPTSKPISKEDAVEPTTVSESLDVKRGDDFAINFIKDHFINFSKTNNYVVLTGWNENTKTLAVLYSTVMLPQSYNGIVQVNHNVCGMFVKEGTSEITIIALDPSRVTDTGNTPIHSMTCSP